mgnify:CR=1 FL=1
MKRLFYKECTLSAMPLTFWFLAFTAMTLIPGYPILVGAFFITLGIFYSFQSAREANDILYSALLPIRKQDVVTGKFLFCIAVEGMAWLLFCGFTLLRMTAFASAEVYVTNAMMPANLIFLADILLMYALFHLLFLREFFRTAYKIGKPFLCYCIGAMLWIGIGETLSHIPALTFLCAVRGKDLLWQAVILAGSLLIYLLVTYFTYRASVRDFEQIDL